MTVAASDVDCGCVALQILLRARSEEARAEWRHVVRELRDDGALETLGSGERRWLIDRHISAFSHARHDRMRRIRDDLHDGSAREVILARETGGDVSHCQLQCRSSAHGAVTPGQNRSAALCEIVHGLHGIAGWRRRSGRSAAAPTTAPAAATTAASGTTNPARKDQDVKSFREIASSQVGR